MPTTAPVAIDGMVAGKITRRKMAHPLAPIYRAQRMKRLSISSAPPTTFITIV
jgi:hypothetical protein